MTLGGATSIQADPFPKSLRDEAYASTVPSSGYERIANFTEQNRYFKASNSVGRLLVKYQNEDETCTATLISKDLVITARHCIHIKIENTAGGPSEFSPNQIFIYFKDRQARDTKRGVEYTVDRTPIEENAELDYAILKLKSAAPAEYRFLTFSTRAATRDEEFFLIHHPRGEVQTLSRFNCRLGGDGDSGLENRQAHLCNTEPGSSGGVLLLDNDAVPQIVGVHVASKASANQSSILLMTSSATIASKSCIVKSLIADASKDPLLRCGR